MSSDVESKQSGKTVLIPVDGSEISKRAFQWYCNNLHQEKNEVILVHANDMPRSNIPYLYGFPFPKGWKETVEKSSAESEHILRAFFEKCKERNIKCRMFMESDSPTDAILRLAKEKHADHIVMGSRGRDPISRALFGSVSYFCTHHSEVPVSVVPPVIPDVDEVPHPLPSITDSKELYENNLGYI
ncbi:universal stress protein A-like protein [Orbicella faveolata]|uniref:universal stress protein A-like protein n=1 Tax=Orbicella faveolata TaxID=48498 RepID=UPI0009E64A9D|nr:universal stress protein A-like protein [Orbicella faveolata]